MWKIIYYILKYIEIPEIRLSYIAYTNTSCIHTILSTRSRTIPVLLFRILLTSLVLTSSFVKRSVACSWRLQIAIEQEVSIRNRDFKM